MALHKNVSMAMPDKPNHKDGLIGYSLNNCYYPPEIENSKLSSQ